MPQTPVGAQAQNANQGPGGITTQPWFQALPSYLQQLIPQYLQASGYPEYQQGQQTQIGALQNQQGLNLQQTQLSQQQLGQQSALQQAGLGLSGQGIGIQQAGVAAEQALAPYQQAVEQQQYGLSQQQLQQQLGQLGFQRGQNLQQLAGQAAQAGVAGGKGGKNAQYGATAGEQQALQGIQRTYGYNVADVQRQIAQGKLGQASEIAGYQYSQGDLARQQQQLSIAAQQNGLSETEVNQRLTQGLQQLGLGGLVSAQDILQQLGGLETGGSSQLMQLLGPLASITGLGFGPTKSGG